MGIVCDNAIHAQFEQALHIYHLIDRPNMNLEFVTVCCSKESLGENTQSIAVFGYLEGMTGGGISRPEKDKVYQEKESHFSSAGRCG